jgi:hypothetical protein
LKLPILTDYANLKKGGMKFKKIFSSETIEKFLFLVMVAILDTGQR